MPSSAFDSFYESFFGDPYMAWHDGLDIQSLLALQGEEREEAERLLLEGLKSGDSRTARGLEALRSHKATPLLKEKLKTANRTELINTARALWELERYPPAAEALIDSLKGAGFWGDRLDAARALSLVNTPESIAALWEALNDPEDLVRHHAATSLLELHGIPSEDYDPHALTIKVMRPETQQEAIEQLRKLIGDHRR